MKPAAGVGRGRRVPPPWEKDLDLPLTRRMLAGDVRVDLSADAAPAIVVAE